MAQPPNNLPIEPPTGGPGIPPRQATIPPSVPSSGPTQPPVIKPPIAPPPTPPSPPEIQTMPQQPKPPVSVPAPKPMSGKGEPEDIFSGMEAPEKISMGSERPALGPKKRGGVGKIILIMMIAVLAIGAIGFAFWFFVLRDTGMATLDTTKKADVTETKTQETKPDAQQAIPPPAANTQNNGLQIPTSTGETTNGKDTPVTIPPPGTKIPQPSPITGEPPTEPEVKTPPVDTDGDGLTDDRELDLGLKPDNPDTDGDGLTDGDEVEKYGTNPLNPDTDGDGFADGSEVGNGYNPRGEGKCAKADCTP